MKLFSLWAWMFPAHLYQTNVAAAVIGGAVVGGIASNSAAGKAADAQTQAADQANATQRYQYDQTREDQAPYREAGYNALAQLQAGTQPGGRFMTPFSMSQFQQDPGYGFRLSEGLKAIQNSAAARGILSSGATLKGIDRYSQDYASNEYNNAYNRYNTDQTNAYNRLAGLSGTGQQANSLVANAGQNMANNISQNQLGVGNARASSYIAGGSAINNALGQGINYYQQQNMLNGMGNSMAGYSEPAGGFYPYGGSNLDVGNVS